MNELAKHLARRIRTTGPLTVADYMAETAGHPRHGYYMARDPFGARGDFITAPEVSQIFGELVGLWCADCWEKMGRPDPVVLVELGPGRGTLMADALRALRVAPEFRQAIRLHLVETSPALRAAQAASLADAKPHWHNSIADLPNGPIIVIANEFLDALPIRQFIKHEDGWHEQCVTLAADGESLTFMLNPRPSAVALHLIPAALRDAPPRSLCETRPAALSLAGTLGRRLVEQGGVALFIDYGYFPSARGDTLQAVRRHRHHDTLANPGEADITAHVDFATFAEAATASGACVWGPVAQGAFLTRLGIAERAASLLRRATRPQIAAIESACRRLIAPEEMGTLFKALAITDPTQGAPAGFVEDLAP